MRGTVNDAAYPLGDYGITPACAGNSIFHTVNTALVRDHPRVCGEQGAVCRFDAGCRGSPPRVRGTGICRGERSMADGITPACAGNRPGAAREGRGSGDHPRVCGEQAPFLPPARLLKGSPPRVRGTGANFFCPFFSFRITPACAGNSGGHRGGWRPEQDHPRVCGEQRSEALVFR